MKRRFAVVILVITGVLMSLTPSQAAWLSLASGAGFAESARISAGRLPTSQVTARSVRLDWLASNLTSGQPVSGYLIRRYDGSGTTQRPIEVGSCATLVSGLTCTHSEVPAGTWRYTVTPVYSMWRGVESPARQVTVAAPTLSLSPAATRPGQTLTGSVTDFIAGQTLRYRLDSSTGPELSGTLAGTATPTAVPASGGGAVTVAMPAGTADGSHLVYAVSSPSGDTAIATVVVDGTPPPVPAFTQTPTAVSGDTATFEFGTVEPEAALTCSLDGAAFDSCSSPVEFTGMSAGSHTFQVRATDAVGNTSAPASYTWTVDTGLPNVAVTFPVAGGRYNNTTFADGCGTSSTGDVCGSADDAQGVTQVVLSLRRVSTGLYNDGTGFNSATEVWGIATGTENWTYLLAATTFPTDGDYVLRARATDGTNFGFDSVTFTIDRTAPPAPTFSSPPAATTGPTVTVAFSSTDTTAGYECQLDGAAYAGCASPRAYSGLANGSHTLAVRAVDAAGNTSPPTSVSWVVDAVAPTAAVTFPTARSYTDDGFIAGCATATTGDLCGSLSDSGSGVASVQVSIRSASSGLYFTGSGFSTGTETWLATSGAASWTYGINVSAFPADGSYVIRARATDNVGNIGFSSVEMNLDNDPPSVPQITRKPPNPSGNSALFEFDIAEAGVDAQCRLDTVVWSACSSPLTYSGLVAGSHTFDVRAVDGAGNTSGLASYTWTVDLDLPTVTIEFPTGGGRYNDARFTAGCGTPTGDVCGSADDGQGVASVQVSLRQATSGRYFDGSAFASSTEVWLAATGTDFWSYPVALAGATEGSYTLRARAADVVGNATTETALFVLDRTPPAAPMITSAPPAVTGRSGTVSFEAEPAVSFQCRLDSAAYAACTSPKAYADLAEGPHTFDVRAVDVAGNAGPVDSASWTVDATGPTVAITFPAADGQYNPGCGTTTTGDVCGTASDATSAVAQVEVSLRRVATNTYYTGTSFTASTPTYLTATGTTSWSYALPLANYPVDGAYELTARATDTVGNSSTRTVSFVIDRIGPTAQALSATNGGTTVGRMQQGDVLALIYSEPITATSVRTGWTGASETITIRLVNSRGNDYLQFYNASNVTRLNLGQVNLRRSDYVSASGTLPATMVLAGGTVTITITLGAITNTSITTAAGAANMDWVPSNLAKDAAGNTASTTARVETDNDRDF